MKLQHFFISALDINEQLPFGLKKTKTLSESMEEQDKAKKALDDFVLKLEKNFREQIIYIGMDVIGEKSYERFMLKNSGFFEIMTESPAAMNAHFPVKPRAEKFAVALKKSFEQILPDNPAKDIFISSIEVQDENDTSLTVENWHKIKTIRN